MLESSELDLFVRVEGGGGNSRVGSVKKKSRVGSVKKLLFFSMFGPI